MYTFDSRCFSDLHKDVFGYRPSQEWHESVRNMDDDEKQQLWDYLVSELAQMNEASAIEEEIAAQRHADNIKTFERFVRGMISIGVGNRKDALEWIRLSQPAHMQDWPSVCLTFGLPLGYLSLKA